MSEKKKPIWRKEYGMTLPFCPNCDEPLYERNKCVFCGQEIDYEEPKNLKKDIVVEYKNVRITQVYGSWGVYVEMDNKLICHMSCKGKMTKKHLTDLAKAYADCEVKK